MKIAIIGYGEIGHAIHYALKKKKAKIEIWDKNKSKTGSKPLKKTVEGADFVFLCVPSWAIRKASGSISPFLGRKTVVISLAKGLEEKTGKTMPEVIKETLPPKQKFAILSGPMIAEEIIAGKEGFGVLATENKNTYKKLEKIFKNTPISVEYSNDIKGVAYCGVVKNIYAVALGIADGQNKDMNSKGFISKKAIEEMIEIIKLMGGNKKTALGTAGLGDYIATAFSKNSLNREAGEKLASSGKLIRSEGVVAVKIIAKKLGKKVKKFEVLQTVLGFTKKP